MRGPAPALGVPEVGPRGIRGESRDNSPPPSCSSPRAAHSSYSRVKHGCWAPENLRPTGGKNLSWRSCRDCHKGRVPDSYPEAGAGADPSLVKTEGGASSHRCLASGPWPCTRSEL